MVYSVSFLKLVYFSAEATKLNSDPQISVDFWRRIFTEKNPAVSGAEIDISKWRNEPKIELAIKAPLPQNLLCHHH